MDYSIFPSIARVFLVDAGKNNGRTSKQTK